MNVCAMRPSQALALVEKNGVMLEAGRGSAPSLAEVIAGEPIRGSWWGHPKAHEIFACSRAIRESNDVLVCRLLGGKVTYVHRRLWPALVKLHDEFDPKHLSAIREIHTSAGKHITESVPFPEWVPQKAKAEAARLTARKAADVLPLQLRAKREH